MSYMYLDVQKTAVAASRIQEVCDTFGGQCQPSGRTDFGTQVYRVPEEFPVSEIEHEDWFCGYDIHD
jgi:hypothetical protein